MDYLLTVSPIDAARILAGRLTEPRSRLSTATDH
jgi:hypothetical protein